MNGMTMLLGTETVAEAMSVGLAPVGAMLAQADSTFWMPPQASTYADDVDGLFYFLYWTSAIMTVLLVSAMIYFAFKYRHREGHTRQPSPSHSTTLEVTWSIIPAFFFLAFFYWGFRTMVDMTTPPDYAYQINVRAWKWSWGFDYPNGATSNVLHVPVDTPIKLRLESGDVIHSFFVPAFRIKKDCVPGRYNYTWFEATRTGEFELFCAEYCGRDHSEMITKVVVMEQAEFAGWLEEQAAWIDNVSPVEAGERLYQQAGCISCHSIDGSAVSGGGPTFQNLYGSQVPLASGETVLADDNYIRESILYPARKQHAGYPLIMQSYEGQLDSQEISGLIEWMKTLSENAPEPIQTWEQWQAGQGGAGDGADAGADDAQPGAGADASGGEPDAADEAGAGDDLPGEGAGLTDGEQTP